MIVFRHDIYLHHGGKLVSIRRNLPQKLDTQQWDIITGLSNRKPPFTAGTDLISQFRSLFNPSSLIVIQNRAGAAGQEPLVLCQALKGRVLELRPLAF